ncbi:inosine-uridine nucleoside N-ribohydrolase [Leifsonia sp. EB41]|uniref:nucleoside hydrolase n=1 Tax=Leifsonia sp. EB41 TaxID=3156260 RepID=UPI0035181438
MRSVILDVDTGNDDAIAIMMAALSPEIELLGCSTVAGNLTIDHTTDNTLRVLDWIGRGDVPVYKGLSKPLTTNPFVVSENKVSVHQDELDLPRARATEQDQTAVEWLVETLRARTQPVTLIPTAPLTNIATAVTLAPEIVDVIEEVVIMGGSSTYGNSTSQAEFNVWADPVASQIVFDAGFERLVLVPLDATRHATVSTAQIKQLADLGTPAGIAAARILDFYVAAEAAEYGEAMVHDALCVAYVLDPEVVTLRHVRVDSDTVGFHTYGRTIVDQREQSGRPKNAHMGFSADSAKFFELLHAACALTVRAL